MICSEVIVMSGWLQKCGFSKGLEPVQRGYVTIRDEGFRPPTSPPGPVVFIRCVGRKLTLLNFVYCKIWQTQAKPGAALQTPL